MFSLVLSTTVIIVSSTDAGGEEWRKTVVSSGASCATAGGGDFTGDGKVDVIANVGGRTVLFVAPSWREIELDRDLGFIHSEVMDVDNDGDLDFLGARYSPGLIVWYEQPDQPLEQRWAKHVVDDRVNGIHGLLVGDVDGDGKSDLLANSAQPTEPFANSLVWYGRPRKTSQPWNRHVFARRDAPGLSHYLGLGDVDGDGRADAASGAKGGPQDKSKMGNWFAWWRAPKDPSQAWKKEVISADEPGATNIHPADVNGDGKTDFIASRGHGQGVIWFEAPDWKRHDIHPTLAGPHCLVVLDLDGDGDVDAATCAKDDKVAAWFENDGRGQFKTHVVGREQAAYDIRALDMDNDSDLDLLIAGQASKNVVWYANPQKR